MGLASLGCMDVQTNRWPLLLAAIPAGMALNLAPGLTAMAWHAPIFLDAIGTIAFTLLFGWREGAVIGALSVLAGGLFNAHMPYFIFTQAVIAMVTGMSARRGGFRKVSGILITGIGMGVIAALVSAPAAALAFDYTIFVGGSPPEILFGQQTGENLRLAFATIKFWVEPVDKILQCAAAVAIIKLLPKDLLRRMDSPASFLQANGFI